MPYGVTASGFVRKTLPEIRDDIRARLRAEFGDSFPLDAASVGGQVEGVFSAAVDELWELAQATYSARDPDAATLAQQDQVGALTGTLREPAKRSTVTWLATGTPGSTIAIGKVVKTAAGDRFQVTTATAVGAGGTVSVEMESVEYGPVPALAGTLTVIETPMSGVASGANPLDAVLGSAEEGDAAYRVRREAELRAAGAAAVDPIAARVLRVADVVAARVFNNRTDTADGDGLPPHSVEVLVSGGDDEEVRASIFAAVAAGTQTHGTNTGTVTDAAGGLHTIKFSRPDELDVWIKVTLEYDATLYPADGDDQVAQSIADWGDLYQNGGKDIVPSAFSAQAFGVSGVLEVTALTIAVVPAGDPEPGPGAYGAAKYVVDIREQGLLDTSRIYVTSTPGTP